MISPSQFAAAVDAAAAEVVAAADGPPAAILAIAEGEHSHATAFGAAELGAAELGAEPATAAHVHDLASVSKLLTVLALHVLFARGELHPTDSLGSLLGRSAATHGDATLDDTLRHRGGFAPWLPLYLLPDTADPLATSLAVPAANAPGTAHRYSDLGMQALGGVIARATSLPFADAVRELVLDPLSVSSITAGGAPAGRAVLAGQTGDDIEREMVRSDVPYRVDVADSGFAWRTSVLQGEIGDGNAHHVFGGAAGHAGWFGDVAGLLRLADGLAHPECLGLTDDSRAALWHELDPGQGSGVRIFTADWNGRARRFIGHGGFTGGCVAASTAVDGEPALRVAILTNRLHRVPATRVRSRPTAEALWQRAMRTADHTLHPVENGIHP
ncbi:serine hydrolase domain-containing protein [Leucobacter sp. NPDC058333]|uniref:serine hydrolase domain-containing protein n=1 Tax=Leucobacter sp. NPDC058333 TaxID=3346450 RepID=UPI0036474171